MAAEIIIKRGSTFPDVKAALKQADGRPVNLTGASITFWMRHAGGATVIEGAAASILGSPLDGIVVYEWQSGDTDVAGVYEVEFNVYYDANTEFRVPRNGFVSIEINPRIEEVA